MTPVFQAYTKGKRYDLRLYHDYVGLRCVFENRHRLEIYLLPVWCEHDNVKYKCNIDDENEIIPITWICGIL